MSQFIEPRSIAILQQLGITVWESQTSSSADEAVQFDWVVVCDEPKVLQQSRLWQAISHALELSLASVAFITASQFEPQWASKTLWLASKRPAESESLFFVAPFNELRSSGLLKQQLWQSWSHG